MRKLSREETAAAFDVSPLLPRHPRPRHLQQHPGAARLPVRGLALGPRSTWHRGDPAEPAHRRRGGVVGRRPLHRGRHGGDPEAQPRGPGAPGAHGAAVLDHVDRRAPAGSATCATASPASPMPLYPRQHVPGRRRAAGRRRRRQPHLHRRPHRRGLPRRRAPAPKEDQGRSSSSTRAASSRPAMKLAARAVEMLVAVMQNVDLGGDKIVPGAFEHARRVGEAGGHPGHLELTSGTSRRRTSASCSKRPSARWTAARPLDAAAVGPRGPKARQVFDLAKERRDQASFAYWVRKHLLAEQRARRRRAGTARCASSTTSTCSRSPRCRHEPADGAARGRLRWSCSAPARSRPSSAPDPARGCR